MSKRKHSALEDDLRPRKGGPNPSDGANDFKVTRLRHRFESGTQLLFRALKTARGFERQKLGRRQKTAAKDEDNKALERLKAEVQALKGLNLEETAQRYLLKQLQKIKRIAESPEYNRLAKTVSVSTTGPRDPAEANVTARLFKSNPVKNVLPGILDGIRSLLGLDEDPKKQKTHTKSQRKEATGSERSARQPSVSGDGSTGSSNPDRRLPGDNNVDNESDKESLEFAQFDDRLASSDDEPESPMDLDKSQQNRRYDAAADLSVSSDSESRSSPASPPASRLKGRQKLRADEAPKDTTFLPSLTMGGYWSGSESGDDIDAPPSPPRRKNRMGQQARRALWEKKYGSSAKHLQKDKRNGGSNKNEGWDSRRGATDGSDSRNKWGKRHPGQPVDKKSERSDRHDRPARPSSKANAPLHPSWEAARKAKMEKSQASFQGKKVTFD